MAIKQTAISYYGLNYVEHAERDFEEMKAHGCNAVILAVTEFDFDFWRPNIPKIWTPPIRPGFACCSTLGASASISAGSR